MHAKTILILGGTRQALDLAAALNKNHKVITSLAGRTKSPKKPAGKLRVGGFGGVKALAAYLVTENIDILVDATHPFAATISKNAAAAAAMANVPCVMLQRPPWQAGAGDNWEEFPDLEAAAENLNSNTRCFLTIGRQELLAFKNRKDVWFLVRMIDAPATPLSAAKLEAARKLGLRVMMIQRPEVPAGELVETVGAVERWLVNR